jgi:hypothetical protein
MPILENNHDRRGRPICPVCDRPITPEENVVLLGESMIHGHFALQSGGSKTVPPVDRRGDDAKRIKRAA